MPTFAVILAAAGQSSRFGDKHYKKPFAPLANKPVWLYSAERFINRSEVAQTILVVAPEDRAAFGDKFLGSAAMLGIEIVDGGAERADSVQRALERVRMDIDYVAVHDAARPVWLKPGSTRSLPQRSKVAPRSSRSQSAAPSNAARCARLKPTPRLPRRFRATDSGKRKHRR